jgi:hypothetical protein
VVSCYSRRGYDGCRITGGAIRARRASLFIGATNMPAQASAMWLKTQAFAPDAARRVADICSLKVIGLAITFDSGRNSAHLSAAAGCARRYGTSEGGL